jgi:uncharacterized membrane protein YgdD (TMEM256/DUF423 family)
MTPLACRWLLVAGVLGSLSVGLGAFAAHSLPAWLESQGYVGEEVESRLANFETAAKYQIYGSLFLLAMALVVDRHPRPAWRWACWLMLAGTLVFAGAVYGVALAPADWRRVFGPVAPLGGTGMILAWAAVALGAFAKGGHAPSQPSDSA